MKGSRICIAQATAYDIGRYAAARRVRDPQFVVALGGQIKSSKWLSLHGATGPKCRPGDDNIPTVPWRGWQGIPVGGAQSGFLLLKRGTRRSDVYQTSSHSRWVWEDAPGRWQAQSITQSDLKSHIPLQAKLHRVDIARKWFQ